MNEPFDTSLIDQRLRDQVAALQSIEGAAEYAAVKSLRDFRPGSAYVVLASERNPNDPSSVAGNRMRGKCQAICNFGVILAARNYRGKAGADALQDARPLISAARTALIGWQPGQYFQPLSWLQGEVLEYDANTILWIDVYTTTHYLGGASE